MAADESPAASKQSKAIASLQRSIERQKQKITDVEHKHNSDKAASVTKLKEISDMLTKITNKESTLHEDCNKELQQLKVMNSGMSYDMECIQKEVEKMTEELEESKIIKEQLEQVTKELKKSQTQNLMQCFEFTEKIRKMSKELEESKKIKENFELISKELEASKSLNDLQQKNFTQETRKNLMKISSLQMAAMRQQNEHEDVLKLAEDLKNKKEQLNAKTVQLEIQQKSKQKLELENHQLKRKLEVMKNIEDEFLKTVGNLQTNLIEKDRLLQESQDYCQSVITKERQSNDELQRARKSMIQGIAKRSSRRPNIGVKRMGQLDNGPFLKALRAKQRCYTQRAAIMCSTWENNLKDPHWHPFKIITIGGELKEIIDEEDEKLKRLKRDVGDGPYQAVVKALTEMNEYNPSGRSVVSELWNHGAQRRATLEEGVDFLLGHWKTKKQKTHQTWTDDYSKDSDSDDDHVPIATRRRRR